MLVAGRLAQSSETTVLLARPAVAAAIAQGQLRILQDGATQVVENLTVITNPAALDPGDRDPELAILCVKGYDTVGALPALEALRPRAILTLQNGTLIACFDKRKEYRAISEALTGI